MHDAAWAERVAKAQAEGKVLRYVFSMVRTTPEHTPGQMWHNRPDESGFIEIGLRVRARVKHHGTDQHKHWLRFPYESTFLRSHDLHPHLYHSWFALLCHAPPCARS